MSCVSRCTIYEARPQFCRDYPGKREFDAGPHGLPPRCTYSFDKVGNRLGSCQPEVCQDGACCNYPRQDGEPEGQIDFVNGAPCKHLGWEWKLASGAFPATPDRLRIAKHEETGLPTLDAFGVWGILLLPDAIPFLASLEDGDARAVPGPVHYSRAVNGNGIHVRCVSKGVPRHGFVSNGELAKLWAGVQYDV